jgi:hypothetical protein
LVFLFGRRWVFSRSLLSPQRRQDLLQVADPPLLLKFIPQRLALRSPASLENHRRVHSVGHRVYQSAAVLQAISLRDSIVRLSPSFLRSDQEHCRSLCVKVCRYAAPMQVTIHLL